MELVDCGTTLAYPLCVLGQKEKILHKPKERDALLVRHCAPPIGSHGHAEHGPNPGWSHNRLLSRQKQIRDPSGCSSQRNGRRRQDAIVASATIVAATKMRARDGMLGLYTPENPR